MPDFLADSVFLRPPRARSGQPALSREQIVKAAVELLDAEGLAGLSMRRLGTRLGAGATSMYWHVTNKDELMELAVDEVFGEIYVPEPADTSWRMALSIVANGMRQTVLRHPWVTATFGSKPTIGPNAMRIGERSVVLLTTAGFAGIAVAQAMSLVNSYAIGAAAVEAALVTATRQAGIAMPDLTRHIEPYLERVAADHPAYDKWWHETGFGTADSTELYRDNFRFGLDRILDGLEQWLTRT